MTLYIADQKITSTPLLEYLANVRQERRDERKRKIEDKKRQREEEKQRKKNQLAKSMPKTIDEDAKVCNHFDPITHIKISNPLHFTFFFFFICRKMTMVLSCVQ